MVRYLSEILAESNTVIIPNFGALTVTDKESGSVWFMPYLSHDDGKLSAYISNIEGVTEVEAKNTISLFVAEVNSKLDSGEPYDMLEFGSFFRDKDGVINFKNWEGYDWDDISHNQRNSENEFEMTDEEKHESLRAMREGSSELLILEKFKLNVWWLNADAQNWNYAADIIEEYPIKTKTKNNALRIRNNFNQFKVGDLFIAYQKAPTQQLFGIYIMIPSLRKDHFSYTLLLEFNTKLSWVELLRFSQFADSVIKSMNAQGSAYKVELPLFIQILKKTTDFQNFVEALPYLIAKKAELYPNAPFQHPYYNRDIEIDLDLDQNVYTTTLTDQDQEVSKTDKIPFHLDVVEKIDRLNRAPVAKSLARLINEDVFDKAPNFSFMVHLQGAWGSGKSTFLNLLEENLHTKNRDWAVVKYNAWQNQHISPPWWTFIDQIYRQATEKMNWWSRIKLKWSENKRRILKYTQWQKIIQLIVFTFFVVILFRFGKSFVDAAESYPSSGNNVSETKGLALDVFAKLILSIGATIGLIFTFSKFIATPFFMRNAKDAESFVKRSADPMQSIKSHFEGLIENINAQKMEVAVFIDDLDRCDRRYTIELLEGIQTLFKDKRVLYVVAGDKDWIATCFEKNYSEFSNAVGNNRKLGELFLEKAFQLSIRLPQMSETSKKKYWNYILGNKIDEQENVSVTIRNEIKKELRTLNQGSVRTDLEQLSVMEAKYGATEAEISDVMLEVLDESQNDIKHLLSEHHALIEPNPRAIIRLANEYTMFRNILWAERVQFNSDILFRWIILESSFPIIAAQIRNNVDWVNEVGFKTSIEKLEEKARFNKLFFDLDEKHGGEMKRDQLADILGISIEKK